MKRYNSIDILRTLAIIGMIQVHVTEFLSGYYDSYTVLFRLSDLVGSFPAPLFTFLVGLSLFVSVNRQEVKGVVSTQVADRNLRRGIAIFFFGLLFATFIWMPEEVFGWDILTLIGASLLILFPLRKIGSARLTIIAGFIILVSPIIRFYTDYHSHWNQWGEYIPSFEMQGMLTGFFANGYFPLLPWLVFPLSGYLVGKTCFGGRELRIPGALLLAGGALILLSLIMIFIASTFELQGLIADYIAPFTFYPASTSFIFLASGINILLFVIFFRFFDLKERAKDNSFLIFCRRYSRYALTAYVVHHAVFVWPLLIAAAYTGKLYRWQYYGEVMPTAYSLLLSFLFVALFYMVIIVWDKREGRYSFEWFLRRLTG